MKKIILTAVATLFLVSCATNSSSNNRVKNIEVSKNAKLALADKNSKERVICRQTQRIGSHRITTICLSEGEIEANRKATQAELERRTLKTGQRGFGKGR